MRKFNIAVFSFLVLAIVVAAPQLQAQATRTWVSGVGDDVNPCSRTAPCKTWAGAISKTAAGGEISALDPGGFGTLTITKSITINGDGTLASTLGAGTNGFVINAGSTDRVIIRNVSIQGAGTGFNGIRYIAGQSVLIDHCSIQNFRGSTGRGIDIALTDVVGTVLRHLTIVNSVIDDNLAGIRVANTSADDFAIVNVTNTHIVNNAGIGIEAAQGNIRINVTDSTISSNATDGVKAGTATTQINLEHNMIAANNGIGVNSAVASARIRIANNTIVNNTTGISIGAGAFVESPATPNNRVAGNGGSTAPNATYTVQ
ncbi:MAG: right-handed parallel beta-helix repeat-containing protein [Acidobacteriota bacterium]|nr:right-handed parallel beta-helix repeat-containing protein [Acidobacteriota bacterium]